MTENQSDESSFVITVTEEDKANFKRLDQYLSQKMPETSRTTVKRLFEDGSIVSDVNLSLNKMPVPGTIIDIDIPPPLDSTIKAENIPLEILFEDEFLVVINKPAGLIVHPGAGHHSGTLVNAILYHCPDLKGVGNERRPGIVHRLDLGTSGVMVVAKEHNTHEKLVELFSKHDLKRQYQAITYGQPTLLSGKIESTIGRDPKNRVKMAANVKNGRNAISYYKVIKSKAPYSHLELTLQTGRTHQIRVHLSQILKTPIVCDPVYANPHDQLKKLPDELKNLLSDYPYQLLHAKHLSFVHPKTGKNLSFDQNPPAVFQKVLDYLN
jgi:23S rRNA pseudouridine1911/1915/1917 synthase